MNPLRMWLVLGRVSNLPTVWTNALAGIVLAGGMLGAEYAIAGIALSLFYIGGMFLNDAFDAQIDAKERSARPIPAGHVSRRTVFTAGYGIMILAVLLTIWLGSKASVAGIALAISIFFYNWLHKKTSLSPVIMGACRFFSYALAAYAVGSFSGDVLWCAIGMWFYIIGLTYAAKQEAYDRIDRAWPLAVLAIPLLYAGYSALASPVALALFAVFATWTAWAFHLLFRRNPGDVPRAVVSLIAGICLYDAVLIAATGKMELAILAAVGFAATLLLQRVAPGT
ncbi:MAG: UbiA family prenyltransferase [Pseudomonadota bacterium]